MTKINLFQVNLTRSAVAFQVLQEKNKIVSPPYEMTAKIMALKLFTQSLMLRK